MEFFRNIRKSIYSPGYYQELLAKPFSYSLKYYALLILLLAVIATAILSLIAIPKVMLFANVATSKVIAYYPEELTITVANGKVSANVVQPYVIAMPREFIDSENFRINESRAKQFKNLLIIDTTITSSDNFNIGKFVDANTAFLLTKDSVIGYSKNGKITIQSLDEKINFKLDKPIVEGFVAKIKPFLPFLYPAVVLIIFLICWVLLVSKLLYLLVGALVIWLIVKIKKLDIGYGKSYQIGLHAITASVLVSTALTVGGFFIYIPRMKFLFTAILILVVVINMKKANELALPGDSQLNPM